MWYESTAALQKELFDGSDSSIDLLNKLIMDGKLLENAYQVVDDVTIQNMISRALHAILIPTAWSLTPKLGVVVIDTGVSCGTRDPLDTSDLSHENAAKSSGCYKNKLYYLLGANGKERSCIVENGLWDCVPIQFSLPPGLAKLDGKAWGGLTKEDFING